MKSKIIIFLLLLISLNAAAQKDTAKVDSVYVIVLTQPEVDNIANFVRSLDEKPSTINQLFSLFFTNSKRVAQPKKEQPKK